MASTSSKSNVVYGADELDYLFENILCYPNGDEVLINARKTDNSLKKIKTLDDFLQLCDNLDVVNALKYRTNPDDASTEVDLPDNYKKILIAVPSYMAWLQTNYATYKYPIPFKREYGVHFPSYMAFKHLSQGKEYLYDEIKAIESEKFHMLGEFASSSSTATTGNTTCGNTGGSGAPYSSNMSVDETKRTLPWRKKIDETNKIIPTNTTTPTVNNGNTAGDDTGRSSTSYTKKPVDELKLANRDSRSETANHQFENCPVVGNDDLTRIINGLVPQQDTVMTREMAYRAQSSTSHTKPIELFDIPLHVRSDPNVVNVFRWRKNGQVKLFGVVWSSHLPEWSSYVSNYVAAASDVIMCTASSYTIYLTSYQAFVDIVLHFFSMHYLHNSRCTGHNDGGESSCARLLLMMIIGHNFSRMGFAYFVPSHDGSLMQSHNGSLMCLFIKYLIMQIGKKIDVPILSDNEYHHDNCNINLSTRNQSMAKFTTSTSDTSLVDTFYKMDCTIRCSLALKCALVMVRQICLCYNCFVGTDNVSTIYHGNSISLLRLVTKYGESSYILIHKQEDVNSASVFLTQVGFSDINSSGLRRSHEKKVLAVTVRSHHSLLHQLCRLVCLGRNKVNGKSSAMDDSLVYLSQFVSYIEVVSDISRRASDDEISYVDYFSIPRENEELANCSNKPKDYGQHNACVNCVVVLRKYGEYTVCSIDTQHPLHREIALQIGFLMLHVCLVTIPTVNHPSLHSSLRKQTGCHCTTADVRRSSCNSTGNQDVLQSDTTTRAISNQPYGASTHFLLYTNGNASSTTSATREVTHVLTSTQFPGILVRRFDEFDPEICRFAIMSHVIGGIDDHLVSVCTNTSVLTQVTDGHIEDGKRGAYNWEEEWGEYIFKDESSLQVLALALLVGCWSVTSCVPTRRDVVSYICKTLYDGRYNDSMVDSAVNMLAPTTNGLLYDVSCIDVKTYVGAKSYDLSCERFLWCALVDFLDILRNRMDMMMRRCIMMCMKFVPGKRCSHTLSTDLDTSFGNVLLVWQLAFSYGRLYCPARSTSQRCIFSMASSSNILLRGETLLVGNNIRSAFYGTTLPSWRVRKLLQALACWFTTICNATILMLNYGEHIIAASIGYVSVVYDLLLALFKFILYDRNNRYDFTRIDRWGVSHNFEIGDQWSVLSSGLCRNGSIRYVELLVRTLMSLLYERVYGGISTEMTTLSSFTK